MPFCAQPCASHYFFRWVCRSRQEFPFRIISTAQKTQYQTMKKYQAEQYVYIFASILTVLGTGMSIMGLLLPYWVERATNIGIVLIKADIGVWQDRVCRGDTDDCDSFWLTDSDYNRMEDFKVPKEELIKDFETTGCALGLLSILMLVPLWATHVMGSKSPIRMGVFSSYFTIVMLAGFVCEVGVLIFASEIKTKDSGWAPFMCGIGGALLLIAGCFSCVVCRYDPTYGTLENPVSPTFEAA
ncbi:hypothetical protein RRG08_037520 [Elysia crispata]|uniref:Uncharacterized protein n=1 Tax=Elysia crispata TaxID=231223 RepID=A0AAE1A5D7_9GAST|nr:hypothetical protein RRG08_037520 [Elysia crispata]